MVSSKLNLRWVALLVAGFLTLGNAGHAQPVKASSVAALFGRLVDVLEAGLTSLRDGTRLGKSEPGANGGGTATPGPVVEPAGTKSDAGTGVDPSGAK